MALGSRAWRALLRRNFVYRRRHIIATTFELLLPVAFLGIVVALKNAAAIEDDDIVSEVKSVGFYESIGNFVALIMNLGLLYPGSVMIRNIVAEKEYRQKELLKMMSVTEADIGWAWFFSFFIFHLATSVLLALVSKTLYKQSSLFLLLLFWIFSMTAMLVMAMMVASVFSKTPRATFVGLLIFFFGYFITLVVDFATGDQKDLRLVSLHPMAAFSFGLREIGRLEDTGYGLTFETMNTTMYDSSYTFSTVLRFLFFDSVLWGLSAAYLNRVIPSCYGQPLPVYFPFLPSYWFPAFRRDKIDVAESGQAVPDPAIPVENVSDALRMQAKKGKSIEIHNLRKQFGAKIAIDDLSLSIYNGQVTALLGVNGAGKTTAINILTGSIAPTEGTAVVAGMDIKTSMARIRKNLGICLQHDCIFPNLTVREHIQLFCRIKGLYATMSYEDAEQHVTESLRDVALLDKGDSLVTTLSGGMKRKLSVAVAFCGKSPVVILDEPTSGMDPFSRRFTWDLIRRYRENRTIILTTHQMDEADVLGDQIAILANGRLRCCGSSLYLKKCFGVGYQLTIEKGARLQRKVNHPQSDVVRTCRGASGSYDEMEACLQEIGPGKARQTDELLTDVILETIQEASLLSNVAGEIKFSLPMFATHKFCSVLNRLDEEVSRGFINSYGLSLTTLEEVFLLVSRGDAFPEDNEIIEKSPKPLNSNCPSQEDLQQDLFLRHVQVLFLKRYLNFKRDRRAWIFTAILPSLFSFIGFLFYDQLDRFGIWFLVVLSFPFITGAFGSFVVMEKQNKSKHLQTIAGVTPSAYWLSTFLWDVMNYQFTLWVTIILMFAFDISDLTTTRYGVVGGVIVLLLAYGPAAASFTYCTSFIFSSPAYCNALNIVFGFLIGFGGPIVVFLLWYFGNGWNDSEADDDALNLEPKEKLLKTAKVLTWLLRFFPTFNLGNGLFTAINLGDDGFARGGTVQVHSVWQKEVLLWDVLFLWIESIFYLLLTIQIDKLNSNPAMMMAWRNIVRKMSGGFLCSSEANITYTTADEDDVIEEEDRVKRGEASSDLVVLQELTKVYDNGKLAVDKMSIGIPAGECFGLLGVNGAGKTTAMGLLTTEFPPSSGDASLAGFSIREKVKETRSRIGYCPQFDALLMNLTGREHVELYGSIKGLPRSMVKDAAAAQLAAVGLSESDSDRLAYHYSGGMKRRLSLACATIGAPRLLFLDEPTTGVDPVGRREIWNMISSMVAKDVVQEGQTPSEKPCVILTTHSMEECEALCSRIGIMAHGKLRCLGSAQYLKSKFGESYQLELKLEAPNDEDEDFLWILFFLCRQKEGLKYDEAIRTKADQIFFSYKEVTAALHALSGDDYLVKLVNPQHPHGSMLIFGGSLATITRFATTEIRMHRLLKFVGDTYPNTATLRERQDLRLRYELSSDSLRMAHIFAKVEENKTRLALADYSVSQTTLENVFQAHAALAEVLKLAPGT